ncbi:MAG: hypothetical protein IJR00_05150 [Lachnospiraceae bacterium]|nr:hypothetical protein [Lachnospiraceae bacterium]
MQLLKNAVAFPIALKNSMDSWIVVAVKPFCCIIFGLQKATMRFLFFDSTILTASILVSLFWYFTVSTPDGLLTVIDHFISATQP